MSNDQYTPITRKEASRGSAWPLVTLLAAMGLLVSLGIYLAWVCEVRHFGAQTSLEQAFKLRRDTADASNRMSLALKVQAGNIYIIGQRLQELYANDVMLLKAHNSYAASANQALRTMNDNLKKTRKHENKGE